MLFHKKSHAHSGPCLILHLIAAGLLLFVTLLSLLGVFLSHVDAQGLVFGTSAGSLSILAFSATLVLFLQHLRNCMTPCEICAVMEKVQKGKKK